MKTAKASEKSKSTKTLIKSTVKSQHAGVQSKPQFKKTNRPVNSSHTAFKGKKSDKGGGNKNVRNHFTFAEEKRLDRIREQNEQKAEKEAKKLQFQKEKKRKLKILSKKNRKGQPVMKGRMELLLEKIEKRSS